MNNNESFEATSNELIRLEIIMSQSIEEDFVNNFMNTDTGLMYTRIPDIMGRGFSVPKMGDSVWPQTNSMYIVYCTEEQSKNIIEIIKNLRKEYKSEGISCFCSKATVV